MSHDVPQPPAPVRASVEPTLRAVAQSLVDFIRVYQEMTWDTAPGNGLYAGMLLAIVRDAELALAAASVPSPPAQEEVCPTGANGSVIGSVTSGFSTTTAAGIASGALLTSKAVPSPPVADSPTPVCSLCDQPVPDRDDLVCFDCYEAPRKELTDPVMLEMSRDDCHTMLGYLMSRTGPKWLIALRIRFVMALDRAATAKPRYGCKQCQRDFDHEPLTYSIGGIPARTFFFCSDVCRDNWLNPGLHPVAVAQLDAHVGIMEEHLENEKFGRMLRGGAGDNDTPMPFVRVFEIEIEDLRTIVNALSAPSAPVTPSSDVQVKPEKESKEKAFVEKICPFCGEDDFDAWGLKFHLAQGGCDIYNETVREKRDGD